MGIKDMPKQETLQVQYKNSKQRERIFQLLCNTDTHPTADWIYSQLKPEIPSLSLGTVYRNLRILMEQGKIRRLENGSSFDRFDADLHPHYHFICKLCNQVLDVELPPYARLNSDAEKATGFQIDDHRIDFSGICKECLSK